MLRRLIRSQQVTENRVPQFTKDAVVALTTSLPSSVPPSASDHLRRDARQHWFSA